MRIVHDEYVCASLGMCESIAPKFFEIGEDGTLQVKNDHPDEAHRGLIEDAVISCPTGALSLEED